MIQGLAFNLLHRIKENPIWLPTKGEELPEKNQPRDGSIDISDFFHDLGMVELHAQSGKPGKENSSPASAFQCGKCIKMEIKMSAL